MEGGSTGTHWTDCTNRNDQRSKAKVKSVFLTEEGARPAQELFEQHLATEDGPAKPHVERH